MKNPRVLGGICAIVTLVLASIAFVLFQQSERDEAAISDLLLSVQVEQERDRLDRSAISDLLRQLSKQHEATPDDRLVHEKACLELLINRVKDAWETHAGLALRLDAAPHDLLLGARILQRLHASTGAHVHVVDAMGFAERCFEQTGSPEALFLAWQCADRSGRDEDRSRIGSVLIDDHGDSPQGRFVASIWDESLTAAQLQRRLQDLQGEFDPMPAELDIALAHLLLKKGDQQSILEAADRLDTVLADFPVSIGARHLRALAHHHDKEDDRRNYHLKWLMEHAEATDPRRAIWQGLLGK